MTFSPTAQMLANAVNKSGLTQRDIADQVGFKHPNMITMMKQGLTRVPLDRIPALAKALGLDQASFLLVAIEEYHHEIYEVLRDTLGLPLSDAEQQLILMFRLANLRAEIELGGAFFAAFQGLLDLTEAVSMN